MSIRASAIDIPRVMNKKTKQTIMYLQNDLCWYSCPSAQQRNDVMLLPCSPEQYAKSLSNPLYSTLHSMSTTVPQKPENDTSHNSLVDYMKCYMSSSSDEDNDVFQYSDDETPFPCLPQKETEGSRNTEQQNENEEQETDEDEFEFDGIFKMDCPITKKICENVALALLQNNE